MADRLQQILEKRKELRDKIYQFRDEVTANAGKFKDAAHRTAWDAVNKEYNDLGREEEELRSALEVVNVANREQEASEREQRNTSGRKPGMDAGGVRDKKGTPTEEERAQAMAAFCRNAMGRFVGDEDIDLMRRCRIGANQTELVINLSAGTNTRFRKEIQSCFTRNHHTRAMRDAESRAMTGLVYADGGALVPDTFLRTLEINMVAFGGVRQVADTLTTATGERMTWPTADDTSNTGVMLGESVSIGAETQRPDFSGVAWDAYKFSSTPILVPYELIEDSFLDLPSLLGQMMGERLGRITATKHTTGSGANEPKGIVTASVLGYTAASATAIVYDELIRLEHSVDPAYRNGAGYLCHDNVVLALRLLKDGEGRYLWQSGIDNNSPDRLNGHPLNVSMEMASSIASGAKTVLFGQLSRHKIRRVNQIRMYRLQERYRDNDQDGFIALVREDSNTLTAGTAPIKHLLQP